MLGVFDSGFGGLTVLKPIHDRLPELSTIYLGDNARAPYGTRSREEIFTFALEGVRELFRRGCPLVILACNTASAQALRQIQQTVLPAEFPDRRVLGVIRPTAEEIVARSKTGHIGVMATPATVRSNAYPVEITNAAQTPPTLPSQRGGNSEFPLLISEEGLGVVCVSQVACPGQLTVLIEQGLGESAEADAIVASCCAELMVADPLVDTVLLGCTHYPLVERLFRAHLPPTVTIVTQGPIVADKLADYLERHPEFKATFPPKADPPPAEVALLDGIKVPVKHLYYTTKNDALVSELASRFYGSAVQFDLVDLNRPTN